MYMDPVTLAILLGGGAIAKGFGSMMAQKNQEDAEKENEEMMRREGMREAMQKALGEEIIPYRFRRDKKVDQTMPMILSGLGSVAGQVPSMFGGE